MSLDQRKKSKTNTQGEQTSRESKTEWGDFPFDQLDKKQFLKCHNIARFLRGCWVHLGTPLSVVSSFRLMSSCENSGEWQSRERVHDLSVVCKFARCTSSQRTSSIHFRVSLPLGGVPDEILSQASSPPSPPSSPTLWETSGSLMLQRRVDSEWTYDEESRCLVFSANIGKTRVFKNRLTYDLK
jgi:hypothetical protein